LPDNDTDTDRDTLTDWEEVKEECLTLKNDGTYELPAFEDMSTIADYQLNLILYSGTQYEIPCANIWRRKVLPANTDSFFR